MNLVASSVVIGAGATVVVDVWAWLRRRLIGTPPPNYALVGRWIAWLPRGRFRHSPISATPVVRGEGLIGWAAHYAIGVVFAAGLIGWQGSAWLARPTLLPALLWGLTTVLAPFLLMQPGMGAGIAASRLPRPNAARMQSVITHAFFGAGLYLSARLLSAANA